MVINGVMQKARILMKNVFEKIKERLEEETYDMEICEEQFDANSPYFIDVPYKMVKLEDAISIVSEVEAEYGNGWIPCSERLPEKSGRVLVSYESISDEIAVSETSYDYKRKTFWISPCVIAWMPLPEPYKPTTD